MEGGFFPPQCSRKLDTEPAPPQKDSLPCRGMSSTHSQPKMIRVTLLQLMKMETATWLGPFWAFRHPFGKQGPENDISRRISALTLGTEEWAERVFYCSWLICIVRAQSKMRKCPYGHDNSTLTAKHRSKPGCH